MLLIMNTFSFQSLLLARFGFLVLMSFLFLSSCSLFPTTQPAEINSKRSVHSLDGEWAFSPGHPKNSQAWQRIKVPANWYQEGYDIAGIAWYQKKFVASKDLNDKKITLLLKGIDYAAEIWLNGQYLSKQEGYFQHNTIDLSDAIKLGATNTLSIKVDSLLEKAEDFSLNKRLLKGIFSHHDTRPGGAWSERGQEQNTGGIWDSVEIHISKKLFIQHIAATPKQITEKQWRLSTQVHTEGLTPDNTTYHWTLSSDHLKTPSLKGVSSAANFEIAIENPKLWWPKTLGKPHLYKLSVIAKSGAEVLHQKTVTTAFRNITLNTKKQWFINGKRLLLMGTNYIPTQWLGELDDQKIRHDIDLMMEANINTVRVHAHITHPEFYRQCDEDGLLVWQDFPLQWGYQDTPEFHQQAHLQLRDMLLQLGNHPSIIHWTLHNEPPWDANWMKWKYSDYDPKQNHELDISLNELANELEKSRPVSMISSTKEHPWLGWYSGHWLDYAKPTDQPFIAEFGSQALPNAKTMQRIFGEQPKTPPKQKDWKGWEKWQYHNFQPKESFEIANIAYPKNTQELIKNTQHYQARLIQLAAESYRRQAYQPVTALFHFMFVEEWPSMNWGIVDYWRHPKPGYSSLQKAYQPILPSIEWDQVEYPEGSVKLGLWILNDSIHDYDKVQYDIRLSNNKQVIDKKTYTRAMPSDMHEKIADYVSPHLGEGEYTVNTTISEHGVTLSENHYLFTVNNNSK